MKQKSSALSIGNTYSDIGTKVNKFARWVKNSFRRSSAVFVDDDGTVGDDEVEIVVDNITHGTHKKLTTGITSATVSRMVKSADGSVSSSGSNGDMTSLGEILPSSSDEQL